MTSKHVHSITQEAMARNLVIGTNGIKKALKMLLVYPALFPKVNKLHLGAYQSGHTKQCICQSDTTFNRNERKLLRTLISANSDGIATWALLQRYKHEGGGIWSPNHQFFLDILLSLCSNVKDVAIQLQDCPRRESIPDLNSQTMQALPLANPDFQAVTIFYGPALVLMQRKLRSLTILPPDQLAGPTQREFFTNANDKLFSVFGRRIITLPGFHQLKHLDVPMDVVGLPHSIIFQAEGDPEMAEVVFNEDSDGDSVDAITLPAKTLPLSLTRLQLRICNERTFAFLYLISLVRIKRLKLQNVECHFAMCARTSILLCELGDGQLLDYLNLLRNLETMGVHVDFTRVVVRSSQTCAASLRCSY